MVRLNKAKGVFDKGYMPNWTKEHFTVTNEVEPRRGSRKRVYKISDYDGEGVSGSFYPEELQEISANEYRIERILKRRTSPVDGSKEILVKWEGWSEKHNSWIKETDQYLVHG